MAGKLSGKVVAVTGASSGIGEATALRLAREGASLVLGARRIDKLEALAGKIRAEGGKAEFVPLDVTRRESVEAFVAKAVDRFGRLDVLVNNAGIMPASFLSQLRAEDWDAMIDVNLKGVLYGIAAALPRFQKQKSGHFINVASVGGRRVYPSTAVYCGTKFAVRAISEGLRMELDPKDRIRVTVIEPGAVRTELPKSIRDEANRVRIESWLETMTMLEPEDVAESIAYAVTQAGRVNVDEILLMPQEQGH